MAVEREIALAERQRLARCDAELQFDEIEAGHHFGDRMLDLEPRVHFHEIELRGLEIAAAADDEFHRAGAAIADRLGTGDRRLAHARAQGLRHAGCGRFLDHLLMAALQRAIALEERNAIAMAVGQHLDFDMARTCNEFLDQHAIIAEGGRRLAPAGIERCREFAGACNMAHALAAAARHRLDHHRIADLSRARGEE